jgi:alpha-ribazole phosphatase
VKRLWWVRHGPTHAREMTGWTDRPADLSDTAALDRLRAVLPDAPVVSSDLIRARSTAEALRRPLLAPLADLREIHFGAWEGLTFDEAEARDPALIRRFWSEPGEPSAPGGESWAMLSARVNRAVDTLLASGPSEVIVVAHFGPILTQVERALGVPTTVAFAQKIEPLSVTTVLIAEDGWQLERVNHPA